MPDPLDYHNPYARPAPAPTPPAAEPAAAAVVPIEFDAKVTTSADHAAVAAVETALRASKINTFRVDDGQAAGREITLFVRSADLPAAAPIAAGIFARRQRVKSMNSSRPPPESTPLVDLPDVDAV